MQEHIFSVSIMSDKSVETLDSKIRSSSVLETFSPLPQIMLIFLFRKLHKSQLLHNINPGVSEN